jgi:3',5'-cyclic-AMP phosphodiesterase
MTNLIVFSDLHMTTKGDPIIGIDPYARLLNGIRHVNKYHRNAARVVFLGDLSHFGDRPSYVRLKRALDQLELPRILMVGNHDDRALVCELFPDTPRDANGFVQGVVDIDARYRLIFLDSLNTPPRPSTSIHSGYLCKLRLDWLEAQLVAAGRRGVVIFMHHPPHAVGFAGMDQVRLINETAFYKLVAKAGNVRHIFAGHVHRTISGSCRGIPFSIFKSPVHQQPMTFDVPDSTLSVDEPAAYGIVFLRKDSVLVHTEDYEISTGGAPAAHSWKALADV